MKSVDQLLNLEDTNAIVTGASGTIGLAITARLIEAGARVAALYHSNINSLTPLVERHGAQIVPIKADLTKPSDIAELFEILESENFSVNALVNNAADQSVANLQELDLTAWQSMMQTNLDSVFLLVQQAAKRMQGGSIINISSIEGLDPAAGHGHYATSKAAVNMLTRAQALELGDASIRVNTISPGLIRREGIEQAWPEGVARWQERAPLSRLGEGSDIADAVLFLISDAARWVSGANLVVDGGMTAQAKW